MSALLVALGGALGAVLRYLIGQWRGPAWGTLVVNLVGSGLLGVCAGLGMAGQALTFVGVGFCGGLTTFSAFAVQTHDLGNRRGLLYATLTILGSLAACFAGFALVR